MEHLEGLMPTKTQSFPPVYWGKREEGYGLANTLLILIERDPNIWHNLYPQTSTNFHQKTAQCRELAKTLFASISEISIHLQNPYGLENYATSVFTRLKNWENSFIKVLRTMPSSSNWPDQDKIKLFCPYFVRLAPLLWRHMETRKKFTDPDLSMARARLQFCTAITVYNPQRADAQIAFQDAVLRQLRDPLRSHHYLLPYASPIRDSASRNRLPKPNMAYYNPREGSNASLPRGISSVRGFYASQSCEHKPQTSQQNSVSDTAMLSDHKTPEHDGRQTSSGVVKPPQCEKAAQQITIGDLGEKPHRLGKFQLREMEPLLDDGEPQVNHVHQLQLEIMELKGRTAALERIVIQLVGEKRRRCSSQHDQEDKEDKVPLAKRHRRFDNPNPQKPEKARHPSTEREFREAFRYLSSDSDDTEDNPITSTDAMPPKINHIPVAYADFRQAENGEESRPWHPLPQLKLPPQKISHVSSSELFAARLREAGFLEQQPLSRAPSASPHQDEHEPARGFPTATRTQVHKKGRGLGSTYSPLFNEKDVTEFSSWEELDKARLRKWKEEVEATSHISPDLYTVVKDKSERNVTIGFFKHEPLEE